MHDPRQIPDFSGIDSREKMMKLFQAGELVPLYLMPLEFGGEDSAMNTLYVPQFALTLKNQSDRRVRELLAKELIESYSAEPVYKGNSFIPSSITITASGAETYTERIEIW